MRGTRIVQLVVWSVVALLILTVMVGSFFSFRSPRAVTQAEVAAVEESAVEIPVEEERDVQVTEQYAFSHPDAPPMDSDLQVYLSERFAAAGIDRVHLRLSAEEVNLYPSGDGDIRVVQRGRNLDEDRIIQVYREEDALSIDRNAAIQFGFNMTMNSKSVVEVYLPDTEWEELDLRLTSGRMMFHQDIRAKELTAELSSGSLLSEYRITAEDAALQITSGKIQLAALDADGYDIGMSSGTVRVDALEGSGQARITSGNLQLGGVIIRDSLDVEASSGNIRIRLAGDPSLQFSGEKSSGNINAYFPVFSEDNGRRISATVGSGPYKDLSIRITSGNIHIDRE